MEYNSKNIYYHFLDINSYPIPNKNFSKYYVQELTKYYPHIKKDFDVFKIYYNYLCSVNKTNEQYIYEKVSSINKALSRFRSVNNISNTEFIDNKRFVYNVNVPDSLNIGKKFIKIRFTNAHFNYLATKDNVNLKIKDYSKLVVNDIHNYLLDKEYFYDKLTVNNNFDNYITNHFYIIVENLVKIVSKTYTIKEYDWNSFTIIVDDRFEMANLYLLMGKIMLSTKIMTYDIEYICYKIDKLNPKKNYGVNSKMIYKKYIINNETYYDFYYKDYTYLFYKIFMNKKISYKDLYLSENKIVALNKTILPYISYFYNIVKDYFNGSNYETLNCSLFFLTKN